MNRTSNCRSFFRHRGGNAAIEFGFITPAALIMVCGLIEYGLVTYNSTSLENAARAGAHYAFAIDYNAAKVTAVVKQASTLSFAAGDAVNLGQLCECSDNTAITCGNPCADGGPNRRLIQVEVIKSYQPFLPFMNYIVPDEIRGAALLRIQ